MSYTHTCRHCGEKVSYAGIWEAELYWNHSCKELKEYEHRQWVLGVGIFYQPAIIKPLVQVANGDKDMLQAIKL